MISDGDSFQAVKNVYGTGWGRWDLVEKLDCIGQVGKRMFGNYIILRKKIRGNSLIEKLWEGGKRRLTAGQRGMVGRLNELYRNAIRETVNREAGREEGKELEAAIRKMHDAIRVVLYHEVRISDNTVWHQFCPVNDGVSAKRMAPWKIRITTLILKPTFERLSEKSLLQRCVPGFWQNANEFQFSHFEAMPEASVERCHGSQSHHQIVDLH